MDEHVACQLRGCGRDRDRRERVQLRALRELADLPANGDDVVFGRDRMLELATNVHYFLGWGNNARPSSMLSAVRTPVIANPMRTSVAATSGRIPTITVAVPISFAIFAVSTRTRAT